MKKGDKLAYLAINLLLDIENETAFPLSNSGPESNISTLTISPTNSVAPDFSTSKTHIKSPDVLPESYTRSSAHFNST